MQPFMLILNIMFILHANRFLILKISNYEGILKHFATYFEKIDFLSNTAEFFKTHACDYSPSVDGLNDV